MCAWLVYSVGLVFVAQFCFLFLINLQSSCKFPCQKQGGLLEARYSKKAVSSHCTVISGVEQISCQRNMVQCSTNSLEDYCNLHQKANCYSSGMVNLLCHSFTPGIPLLHFAPYKSSGCFFKSINMTLTLI